MFPLNLDKMIFYETQEDLSLKFNSSISISFDMDSMEEENEEATAEPKEDNFVYDGFLVYKEALNRGFESVACRSFKARIDELVPLTCTSLRMKTLKYLWKQRRSLLLPPLAGGEVQGYTSSERDMALRLQVVIFMESRITEMYRQLMSKQVQKSQQSSRTQSKPQPQLQLQGVEEKMSKKQISEVMTLIFTIVESSLTKGHLANFLNKVILPIYINTLPLTLFRIYKEAWLPVPLELKNTLANLPSFITFTKRVKQKKLQHQQEQLWQPQQLNRQQKSILERQSIQYEWAKQNGFGHFFVDTNQPTVTTGSLFRDIRANNSPLGIEKETPRPPSTLPQPNTNATLNHVTEATQILQQLTLSPKEKNEKTIMTFAQKNNSTHHRSNSPICTPTKKHQFKRTQIRTYNGVTITTPRSRSFNFNSGTPVQQPLKRTHSEMDVGDDYSFDFGQFCGPSNVLASPSKPLSSHTHTSQPTTSIINPTTSRRGRLNWNSKI
eukprot:TRINITY_DN4122_c0_g1_i11.p1 TRINITY_DN4122_c0_g1~~TRINITY_DN4122_c0_g1_i11.p1  ORF type:complete len:495 (-),score=99.30 TRINITY_DN4122_c0_g1_i11:59-1543(-)